MIENYSSLEERLSWMDKARCKDRDPTTEIFFPPRDKTKYSTLATQAKAMCLGPNNTSPCPVRKECLWFAVESDEQHGIWGGMSHRERNALVRKWQRKFKDKMTLKEYIFQIDKKEYNNGSK
jgi:WhiB family redox-sensing transcriptional regulator